MTLKDTLDQLIEAAGGAGTAHSPGTVAARLAAAVLVGWVLSAAYRRTHTGQPAGSAIPHTQVLLAVGGALIWLVVGDNLVRAFGLAGTIGLIRYRTRIRDPKDTTVLLFSMILGMACGLGQFLVAGLGTVFVVATLFWLASGHRRGGGETPARDRALRELMDIEPDE